MTRRETPAEWMKLMEPKRLHSVRDLAAALDISPQTATRLVHGEQSSRETIEAAAELLGVSADRIRELRHETALPPFRLPPEADQLGQRQRAAIVAVVRAMLEPPNAAAIEPPTFSEVPTEGEGERLVLAAFHSSPEAAEELKVLARAHMRDERAKMRQSESSG